MKNIFLLIFIAVFFVSPVIAKEKSIKTTPEKPKAGDEITIVYNPAGTALADAKNIEIIYSVYSNQSNYFGIQETHILSMDKSDDAWKIVIKTPPNTEIIAVKFTSDELSDNNDLKGYFIRIYDEQGNETVYSRLGYATALISWPNYNVFCDKDFQKGYEILKQIFSENPDLKQFYLGEYLNVIKKYTPDSLKSSVILKELTEVEELENVSDKNYHIMISNYDYLKMPAKAEELIKKAINKYPGGSVAYQHVLKKLNEENNIEIKKQIVAEAEKAFKEIPPTSNTSIHAIVFQSILKSGDMKMLHEWWDYTKKNDMNMSLPEVNQFVSILLKENKGMDLALELSKFIESNWNNNYTEKRLRMSTCFFNEKQFNKLKNRDQADFTRQYGDVLFNSGNKEEALQKYEKAFSIYDIKNFDEKTITGYVKKLIETKRYNNVQPVFETAVKQAIEVEGLQDALKDIYIKMNGNENGFEKYFKNLLDEGRTALEAKLKKLLISQPAQQFTLVDLDGKKVSLADYKGKVVVLDFWATWCVPCKESFPAMQKTIEKYKDDKDVVFLFVNTWQSEVDKKKNAEDFLKKTKYPFHVLLDSENKVLADYKVRGIPTKFIIDGNGNIRFNVVGAKTGDMAVEELSYMIELARK